MSRFGTRGIKVNRDELYNEIREERDVNYIRHYVTPNFQYPTPENIKEFIVEKHFWKAGDKFYKLAHEYYGDSKLWWVIAWYNKTPTESHVELGKVLSIPKPIQKVLRYLGNT